ncbi:hypothetical protein NJL88_00680 [Streptomyces sp. DK15]|nr:hypothetical protein [Streptomyces sp. DK15]
MDLVHQGVRTAPGLAARTGAAPRTLGALLTYLVALDVFAADESAEGGDAAGGVTRYRLTPVGEELVEDDHSLEEYDLRGAQAALDLSLAGLAESLWTGRAGYRTLSGLPLAEAMASDERLAGSARAAVEDEALWIAPGVVGGYDWASAASLTAGGHGAGAVVNSLVRAFPGLKVTVAAQPSALRVLGERVLDPDVLPRVELLGTTGPVPPGDETVLLCRLLDLLPDADAALVLRESGAALPAGGTLLLVEQVATADADDVEAALHHLRLASAFGSAVRSQEEITELAEGAGLRVRDCRDIGWDHRLWVLAPTADEI